MKKRTGFGGFGILVLVLACAAPTQAQESLSDADVQTAITKGLSQKGRVQGLHLTDKGQSFMNGIMTLGSRPGDQRGQKSGFSIRVYTPLAWIEQQGSDAAKEFRPLQIADIGEEDRAPVLRVLVFPDKAFAVFGAGGTSSVQHVVLRDEKKTVAVQPMSVEPFGESTANAMGGHQEYVGIKTTFSLADLEKVRGSSGTAEFLVTIIGEGKRERTFKVKTKDFKTDLPGLDAPAKH